MQQQGVFQYTAIDRVRYGSPFDEAVAAEAAQLNANRVFVLASGTLVQETDSVDRLKEALGPKYAGLYDQVGAHTPRTAVVEAANMARTANADLIVTLGGGSVTDGGKMVVLCLANDVSDPTDLDRFYTRVADDGASVQPDIAAPDIRMVAVPTTLSGGEFNFTAGCTDTERRMKQLYRHHLLAPQTVILDPAVTVHTPEWLWLSTGIRAVDHAVENLCSTNPLSYVDGTSAHALKLLGRGLSRVKADPTDLDARLDCLNGAWLSMTGAMAGVMKGASHGIGHVLGGTANVPHGHTSCVMLPNVLRYNKSVNAEQQATVSAAFDQPGEDAADVVRDLVARLDQPGTLRDVGLKQDQLDDIARKSMHDRYIHTNPRPITSPKQVREILDMAW
ncbi:MAG: iron-containing alcohol dehydrogenase [Alphaproteobacteria bacterium]|nr:iron-containing alcohol dehydrogenase [Alphaproteobacteria bacterium]